MEELKQKSEPGMAFVGVLLLIVFGIMIFNDRPVQSPRPYDTPYPRPLDRNLIDHSYESWPWEDPFDFKPGEILERDLYQIETDKVPNFSDPGKIDKQQNFQIRLHKSLNTHDLAKEKIEDKDLCSSQFNKKLADIKKPIKILTSIVKVHSRTVENKENRTRQRYAINAGLTASGYTASEPNRLNFCTSHKEHNKKYNVRWEHFSKSDKDVIVAWVTDNSNVYTFIDKIKEKFKKSCRSKLEDEFYIIDLYN